VRDKKRSGTKCLCDLIKAVCSSFMSSSVLHEIVAREEAVPVPFRHSCSWPRPCCSSAPSRGCSCNRQSRELPLRLPAGHCNEIGRCFIRAVDVPALLLAGATLITGVADAIAAALSAEVGHDLSVGCMLFCSFLRLTCSLTEQNQPGCPTGLILLGSKSVFRQVYEGEYVHSLP
jgi:hypothetical protein